ncbi:MAG: acyl-CoA desaturase [Dehalococcoidia bacterium]
MMETTLDNAETTGSYRELKRLVSAAGLLETQPRYYAFKIPSILLMMAGAIAVLVVVGESWWQMGTAVLLAVVGMQAALIGHDGGHRQIFRSARRNDLVPLLITSPFLGLNFSWWMEEHNQHHATPNHEELDPNINMRFWAFTKNQRQQRRGVYRFMAKYQAIFVIPLNTIGGLYKVVESARYIKNRELRYPKLEPLMYALYVAWLLTLLFVILTPVQAVAFLALYYTVFGLYLGMVIAPNHKGMLMVGDDNRLDFLHWQVLTARNFKGNPLTDFLYGGLNYQIEHHLFPSMPRNRLPDAVKIVRPYCQRHGIAYHETGVFEGFREILQRMHRSSAPLRGQTSGPSDTDQTEAAGAPGS